MLVSPSHICHLVTVYTQPRLTRLTQEQGQNRGSQKTLTKLASEIIRALLCQWEAGDTCHISLDSVTELRPGTNKAENTSVLESAITRFERWSISLVAPDLRVTSSPLHWPHYITVYHMQYSGCTVHYTG